MICFLSLFWGMSEWNQSPRLLVSPELGVVWLSISVESILNHYKCANKKKDGYTKVLLSHHTAVGADPELSGRDVWGI